MLAHCNTATDYSSLLADPGPSDHSDPSPSEAIDYCQVPSFQQLIARK
jgi:hypothetical protein